MPIIGLTKTDDGKNIAKLTRLGKLFKGAPKQLRTKNGKQVETWGKDLPHFRIEFAPQFKDLLPIWQSIYGTEPTEFKNVYLLGSTVDEAFENWREERTGTVLMHRCDGVTQIIHYDQQTHTYINAPTACCSPVDRQTGLRPKNCGCAPKGRLKLLFREFLVAANVLGYIEVSTGSKNDIQDVSGYLVGVEGMFGSLAGVPFIFGRAAREISTPMQEKQGGQYVITGRAMTPKSLFYIQVMPDHVGKTPLLAVGDAQAALPATVSTPNLEQMQQMSEADHEAAKQQSGDADVDWIDNQERFEKFLAWAKEKFNFDLEQILVAFENAVSYEVTNRTQWHETPVVSLAAVIAAACDYDLKAIEKITSQMNRFDVYMAADEIIRRVQAESADEAELVE